MPRTIKFTQNRRIKTDLNITLPFKSYATSLMKTKIVLSSIHPPMQFNEKPLGATSQMSEFLLE